MTAPFLLLQLALWTLSAVAFYPFTPEWLKEKEASTLGGEAKRNDVAKAALDGATFKLEKKRQPSDESPALLAAQQAAWLKSKFRHSRSGASAGSVLGKRGNAYSIMQAVQPGQSMAAGINQDGTDYSYFIKAEVGSKNKQIYMLLDTGAGSSWVMGADCTDAPCSMHTTFGQDDSSTYTDAGKPFSISYGSGTVNGSLVTDTISVAGISMKYTFGRASHASEDFSHFAFDGILGMSMSQGASDNFLKVLADSKKLDKNIFGIHLNRASDGSNDGEIKFGSTNSDKYTGNITYNPVTSQDGDWAIQIDDMAYDGKKSGAGGVLSYLDTGTSFVFGPPGLTKKIHDVIPGSASSDGLTYTVPCDSNKSLTFTFSGVDYQLSPKDWISPKDNSGKCTSNIYGHEVVEGSWLMGDTFLKNVYAVFDKDEKRIGFAVAAGSPGGSSSSSSLNSGNNAPTQTTVGPTTGTATALTTDGISHPDDVTQSKRPPLGVSGQETGNTGSTGSPASPSPTGSSKSSASGGKTQEKVMLAFSMLAAALLAA